MVVEVEGKKAALVVVDVQNKFYTVNEGMYGSVNRHIGEMNRALDMFHESGSPVVLICYDPMNSNTSD